MSDTLFRLAELERLMPNVIRMGTVAEANYAKARVRVRSGEILTQWLPWITQRASNDRTWHPPEVGEQGVLLAPNGDLAQAVFLYAMYQTAHPAPENRKTMDYREYADGAVIYYDREVHKLYAYIPGDIVAEATQDVNITVGRDVQLGVTGNVTATVGGDVTATVQGEATINAQGAITLESAVQVRLAAPSIVLDGPITQGAGSNGGGSTFKGPLTQTDGDITSDGISVQHHVHPENDNGGPTGEPL